MRSYIIILVITTYFGASCKKYLEAKPDSRLVVPTKLNDLQLLLDNYAGFNGVYPYFFESLSDNVYLQSSDWNSLPQVERNLFLWKKEENTITLWSSIYQVIYNSNIVLESLGSIKIDARQEEDANTVKGSALFHRAYSFYNATSLFAKPYDENTAATQPGIPLRLDPNFKTVSVRATIKESYGRIINDLHEAVTLLPERVIIKTRPSKAAAFGLLAKVYLSIRQYDSAGYYADKALQIQYSVIDFNDLDTMSLNPIAQFNEEVIFHTVSENSTELRQGVARIDSTLFASYENGDLRKPVYFIDNGDNTVSFKGDYGGTNQGMFGGIATDEMYLIRAESMARKNQLNEAAEDLNYLLSKRYSPVLFFPISIGTQQEILSRILIERRKELIYRGTRWTDIKRLNTESAYSKTLQRVIDNEIYELEPNSPRYILQIPLTVIQATGMMQND